MKKIIIGIFVGALMFGAIPALANTVGNLVGAKVTGTYTVQKSDGTKIADGAVINGSTLVPVRAIFDAVGTGFSVDNKNKVITLEETNVINSVKVDELNVQRNVITDKIKSVEGMIVHYETVALPRAEERLTDSKGTDAEKQQQEWLDNRNAEYIQYKSDLEELKKQLTDLDAQITELSR